MLDVKIEKILPVTEARDSFNKLIDEVESSDELYVLTKNGKPAAVLVGVHHLEKLTGTSEEELMDQTNQNASNDANVVPVTTDDTAQTTSAVPATNTPEPLTEEAAPMTPAVEENNSEMPLQSTITNNPVEETTPLTSTEPIENIAAQTPVSEPQQSGATADPLSSANPTASETTMPTPADDTSAEDPLDFLSDNSDPISPAPEAPVSAPDTTMSTPAAMPTEAPVATEPVPAATPVPETPVNSTTPPTQPSA